MRNQGWPSWYNPCLIANPWYFPREEMICRCAQANPLQDRSKDKKRRLVVIVDGLNDFTFPPTFLSTLNGQVTRLLSADLRDQLVISDGWEKGNNRIVWTDDQNMVEEVFSSMISMAGGRLSVPNAWIGTKKSVEWSFRNVAMITDYALLCDQHPITSRWNMHYWVVRCSHKKYRHGDHLQKTFGTSDFFVLKPEMVWHPIHNPEGWLRPVYTNRKEIDEAYAYVKKIGFVVLWDIHCTNGAIGGCVDSVIMSMVMDHAYRRNAEFYVYYKGRSYKTDQFGSKALYHFSGDSQIVTGFSLYDMLTGGTGLIGRPYDEIIVYGQASSHCVPDVITNAVEEMENHGQGELAQRIVYLTKFCQMIPGFDEETKRKEEFLRKKGVRVITEEDYVIST